MTEATGVQRPHMSLGELVTHPVTVLIAGTFKALIGIVVVLAGIIGTDYIGDIKGTIERLAVQLGDMDQRLDILERESAVRAATFERDRAAYEAYRKVWKERNPQTAADAEADIEGGE